MKEEHLGYLVCIKCGADLSLQVLGRDEARIQAGTLTCTRCAQEFPIIGGIPRFVPKENYASGFGFQWAKHARTQYDSYSGAPVSETRFFNETKWPRKLEGETILEVGSGSGRFTEQAASTDAMVVSMDYSYAVEANYQSNGKKDNVLIVQGDIYQMPFRKGSFDKVLCIGVLQHTPDVRKSFMVLPEYLKPNGSLVVDVYREAKWYTRLLFPSRWIRRITRKMEPQKLYNRCRGYIQLMWPLSKLNLRIPVIGRVLNTILVVPNYGGTYNLSEEMLREWAILDAFDLMSPAYDQPQTIATLEGWFREAGMTDVEVHRGYNGIEGRGRKSS